MHMFRRHLHHCRSVIEGASVAWCLSLRIALVVILLRFQDVALADDNGLTALHWLVVSKPALCSVLGMFCKWKTEKR